MNITQLWNTLAESIWQICVGERERAMFPTEALDVLLAGSDTKVFIHLMGEPTPCYLSPSIHELLAMDGKMPTSHDILTLLEKQSLALAQVWRENCAYLRSDPLAPMLSALPFKTFDGSVKWFSACCGLIDADATGGKLAMGFFLDMQTLGPVALPHVNGHDPAQQLRSRLESLTKRERELLALMMKGIGPQGIADTLFISVNTVQTHRRNIISKMEAESFVGLVAALASLPWPNGNGTL